MRILFNGKIHTQSPSSPVVSALVIDHGLIIAIGEDRQILETFPQSDQSLDLGGATVIPGLTDAHIHLRQYALNLNKIDCDNLTLKECMQRITESANRSLPGDWILGHGLIQNDWGSDFASLSELNKAIPKNPVYITAKSLHAAWVNHLALKLARINIDTPDPTDGEIVRDPNNNPAGILLESAMDLVSSVIPNPPLEESISAMATAQEKLLGMGITSIHDFDDQVSFSALQTLQARGDLKLRVIKSIPFKGLQNAVELGLHTGFGNEKLRIGGIKIFMDGALGSRTAAMFTPYENDQNNRGMLFIDNEELFEQGIFAVKNGLSLAIHAIGDRANNEALKALSRLRVFEKEINIQPQPRHRIEHVQLLAPKDFKKFSDHCVCASMQPIHAVSDMTMADQYWGSRSANSYSWKTLLNVGAVLAFGSDAPVESPNPFWGIHAAVTRQRENSFPGPNGWYPDQRLSIDEAIMAYSVGPAFASGNENTLGRLSPSYQADLLVLDRDLFHCRNDEIREIKPIATMIGGEWLSGCF